MKEFIRCFECKERNKRGNAYICEAVDGLTGNIDYDDGCTRGRRKGNCIGCFGAANNDCADCKRKKR